MTNNGASIYKKLRGSILDFMLSKEAHIENFRSLIIDDKASIDS